MDIKLDLNCIGSIFKKNLESILEDRGGLGILEYIPHPTIEINDNTTNILVRNKENKKIAVLLCAKSEYSENIERNVKNAQKAKKLIPGNVILDPLFYIEKEGITCAVWPYCKPFSGNPIVWPIQRYKVRSSILLWLREVMEKSLQKTSIDEQENSFLIPLENLASNVKIDRDLTLEIKSAISNLEKKTWSPKFVLAHNDFRKCNILQGMTKKSNFTVIDWAGANFNGFALYDLICISSSLNLSVNNFVREVNIHCKILDCDIKDSKSYLLASLANLGMNLKYFPEEHYLDVVKYTTNYLFSRISG